MPTEVLTSEQAFAHGALESGVRVVTGYPGSPSTGTLDALVELTDSEQLYVEWSTNEKVALEVAIGASLAGRRALVCVKSVGMNALVDPLMVVNITGVHAGLVILLGDDPGAYGSQNDQDTRPIATLSEIPLLEPATPAEAHAMMVEAYRVSEHFNTVVVIRETRSFSQQTGPVTVNPDPEPVRDMPMRREPLRFVTYPRNAVAAHRTLHEKLLKLAEWSDASNFNSAQRLGSPLGIIGVGFAYSKLRDVVGEAPEGLSLLKLGTLYPPPTSTISRFLEECDEVLVLEENEPYLETEIKAVAQHYQVRTRIVGKHTGHVAREGELFRWQIQETLERWEAIEASTGVVQNRSFSRENEADERPYREDCCAGCPYPAIVAALKEVGKELGQEPILIGDPGCVVKAAPELDAKYSLGSAAAVAQGVARSGVKDRAVAIFGDSAFFHTGVSAVINAVYQEARCLMVVLDNSATVTSGFQPNPGTGLGARGQKAPRISIEAVAAACGVESITTVGPDDDEAMLRKAFRAGLSSTGLDLIVVRWPCAEPE